MPRNWVSVHKAGVFLSYLVFVSALQAGQGQTDKLRKPPLAFDQFMEFVREGRKIESHTIPATYLEAALGKADPEWLRQKENSAAALKIHNSEVTGTSLQPMDSLPQIPLSGLPQAVQPFLPDPVTGGIRTVCLKVELSNSVIQPKVVLANLLFREGLRLEGVIFEQDVDFTNSIFEKPIEVVDVTFRGLSIFSATKALAGAGFERVRFEKAAEFAFLDVTQGRSLSFTNLEIVPDFNLFGSHISGNIYFESVKFRGRGFFNQLNSNRSSPGGTLSFVDVTFADRAYFDESRLARLIFSEPDGHRPSRFSAWVTFANSQFGEASFKDAEFLAPGNFASRFRGNVDFRWAHFAGEASFVGAEFAEEGALHLTGFRLEKPLRLRWDQVKDRLPKFSPPSQEDELVYLTLLDNFRMTGDLDSENECRYAWRQQFHRNWLTWAIWGYGVRPAHTLICLLLAFVGLTAWNCHLLNKSTPGALARRKRWWNAAKIAFETSWVNLPPLHYAEGEGWKLLLIGQWLLMKTLEVVFLVACSNTSQLLKELVPRLLPG